MDRVEQGATWTLSPAQAFGQRPRNTLGAHLARFEEEQDTLAKNEGGFDFGDPDARAGIDSPSVNVGTVRGSSA